MLKRFIMANYLLNYDLQKPFDFVKLHCLLIYFFQLPQQLLVYFFE